MTAEIREEIGSWAEEAAEAFSLYLYDLEIQGPPRWTIQLYVDAPGGVGPGHGVTVDECAEVSRYIEALLDADERVPENYVIEVSSPGVERKIRTTRQVEMMVGNRVQLNLREKLDGRNTIVGELVDFAQDDEELTIDVEDSDEQIEVPWGSVARAKLAYDFDAED